MKQSPPSSMYSYGLLDRWLHEAAFRTTGLQCAVADIEQRLFASSLRRIQVDRPVFIASLPRCGTTLLLELLCGTGEFAAHSYVDMPFVLNPMLWSFLTRRHRKRVRNIERAHGDGVLINFESPEEFEEIVWRAIGPERRDSATLKEWTDADLTPQGRVFLVNHLRKILALRGGAQGARRYLSKNNANIARIDLLGGIFPDCTILVPFRAPVEQASSIERQHRRFTDIQRGDRFALDYMKYLGHLEFGDLFTPFVFGLRGECRESSQYESLACWVSYWKAIYAYLLGKADSRIVFLDFDELRRRPEASLFALALRLKLAQVDKLTKQSHWVLAGEAGLGDPVYASRAGDLTSANSTYSALKARAINRGSSAELD